MRKSAMTRVLAGGLGPGLGPVAPTACGASERTPAGAGGGGGGSGGAVTGLRVMVPNSPGSGYDLTARAAAKAMEDAQLARNVEVFNVPGASGTVGLQRIVNEQGNGKLLMQMGLGVVGAAYTNNSQATLKDTTPIAKLIEEPEVVVVPAASPYQDLAGLVAAWKADPTKVAVGGGSSPGGPDHLAPHLLAQAAGVDPKTVNYVAYDGGGELLTSLLGGQIAFGMSGAGEFADQIEAKQVRVLAVTSAGRVPGLEAPPRKDAVTQNNFTDAYLPADQFATFLQAENERVAGVLRDLGLTQA